MTNEKDIDVKAIMEEIRKRAEERIKRGEFSHEEIRNVEEMELSIQPNVEDLLDEIKELSGAFSEVIAPMNDLWAPHRPVARPGLKGKLFALAQKVFSPLTRVLLATQMEFNAQVVRSFNDLKVYLARIIDLTSNLAYRHYLVKIQREMEKLNETQMRLFRLTLRAMNQNRGLRGELRRLRAETPVEGVSQVLVSPAEPPAGSESPADKSLEESLYLSFEDLHRGNREEIKARQRPYLAYFEGCRNVLDIGCGRGEFLELLRESGISAKGVDLNPTMVDACRKLGLEAEEADAVSHLSGLKQGHYDGIFCAQVIEHLSWGQLLALIKLGHEKLAEGGKLIMETINPQSLSVFCGAFYLDPTHVKPVHPLTLQFACKAVGFASADIRYASFYPDEMKLAEVDFFRRTGDISDKLVNVLNNNVIQLNELLYGPQDYAVIAVKGEARA